MRKFLAFLIAVCMCLTMVACGSVEEVAEPSAEPTVEANNEPVVEKETEPTGTEPTKSEKFPIETTINEQIVYDDGQIKLTAKEIDFSDDRSINIKFLAENNSNANIAFVGDYFSINGITMYCGFYIEVAAGKKANDVLEIDRDDLAAFGIDNIATVIARDIFIYDDDASETLAYLDFEIQTSIADGYKQAVDNSGQVVYDENGVVIKYRGIVKDWSDEDVLSFYIENNSSPAVSIYTDDVSVNGFMVYGSMVAHAYPNCVTYEELDFSSSDMEENEIDSIEEVTFTMYAYDDEANKKVWETDEITVYAEVDLDDSVSNVTDIDNALAELKRALSYPNLDITYNNGIVCVSWWTDAVSWGVSLAKDGDEEKESEWNLIIDSEISQCKLAKELFEKAGYNDISVSWTILDDTDISKPLLTIVDGKVTFNAAE